MQPAKAADGAHNQNLDAVGVGAADRPNEGSAPASGITVRPAVAADAEALRLIYNHYVETSTVTFDLVARTPSAQRNWLLQRTGAYAVIVAERDGQVLGFASLSPYRDRPAYVTSCENSIYVDPEFHGQGLGRVLLGALIEAAHQHGFHAVMARVVGGHDASIGLHESLGFEVVGTEREVGRKFGRWLDVVLMQLLLVD